MIFTKNDHINVVGKTKGRGFLGVVKRHGFKGPPKSHGATMGKKPGSIGSIAACGKVVKNKKMPGRDGNEQRMSKNLKIIKIMKNMLIIKGSVAGKIGSLLFLRKI